MKGTILIIEDEKGLVMALEDRLGNEGYQTRAAYDGIKGELEALSGTYDLIILDIMLPLRDGFQVCKNLREHNVVTPVLFLTARSTNIDTVMGLKLGGDDYLTKPFDMQVLLARIEAVLRRHRAAEARRGERVESFGPFTIDYHRREVLKNGSPLVMNALEYRLLEYFGRHPGRIIDRQELLDEVWGYDSQTSTRTVDVHMARLRSRLEEPQIPRYFQTIRGAGYKFDPAPQE
ncbi:MAG: response regulator transcription factor [Spirochaetales bacterium]|nr:response regulator transcription factor [Spirochaetales bacterium]